MKRLLVLLLAIAVGAAIAVPALAGTRTVKVGDNYFLRRGKPATLHIHRGGVLRFNGVGSGTHNLVLAQGPRHIRQPLNASGTDSKRFRKRGTYLLVCTIHTSEMRLKVKVR